MRINTNYEGGTNAVKKNCREKLLWEKAVQKLGTVFPHAFKVQDRIFNPPEGLSKCHQTFLYVNALTYPNEVGPSQFGSTGGPTLTRNGNREKGVGRYIFFYKKMPSRLNLIPDASFAYLLDLFVFH